MPGCGLGLVHVDRLEDALRDMHAPGGLEAVVKVEARFVPEQLHEVLLGLALFADAEEQVQRGAGPIPPGSGLVFDLELVDIVSK